jgi:hypothetical protein
MLTTFAGAPGSFRDTLTTAADDCDIDDVTDVAAATNPSTSTKPKIKKTIRDSRD